MNSSALKLYILIGCFNVTSTANRFHVFITTSLYNYNAFKRKTPRLPAMQIFTSVLLLPSTTCLDKESKNKPVWLLFYFKIVIFSHILYLLALMPSMIVYS